MRCGAVFPAEAIAGDGRALAGAVLSRSGPGAVELRSPYRWGGVMSWNDLLIYWGDSLWAYIPGDSPAEKIENAHKLTNIAKNILYVLGAITGAITGAISYIYILRKVRNARVFDGVPTNANFKFVGRKDELNEIHSYFFQSGRTKTSGSRRVLIHALGGFGKSSLARKYARQIQG